MFYSVLTNLTCLCLYSESVPRSHATLTNNLATHDAHVANHLIISTDKDSNSETNEKLCVRDRCSILLQPEPSIASTPAVSACS
jgi:hypothetical protein